MKLPAKIVVPTVKRVQWPVAVGYWAIWGAVVAVVAVSA